ncbi:MAG: glycosyl transferase [Anaerocolumna sp.]|jgi:GT2 family glycosyltransferase|nr:glycosyl transferase [Anaerocolumna sp.]
MSKDKLTSIVILSFNQFEFTKNCLESIRSYTEVPYEIIIVDNNSNQETIDFLEQQTDILLIRNLTNKGFASGCNQGIKSASGDYILLLNNDTVVTPNYLSNMIKVLESESKATIVGPYTNNTIGKQKLNIELDYSNKDAIIEYGAKIADNKYNPIMTPRLIGFCMLLRKDLIGKENLFDEAFKIGNYEDDDLCIRTLLNGNKMYICNNSFVYHYKRGSFDRNKMNFEDISLHNKLVLEEKWDNINWNHYAETNSYMENRIVEINPKKILHIGCGIGAMGISIKQKVDCTFDGIERHPISYGIASQYLDKVFELNGLSSLEKMEAEKYDVVIIEDMIEQFGFSSLRFIEKFIHTDSIIYLRVFNKNHITTIESLVCGQIWGRTIGAASPYFSHYYGDIEERLRTELGYSIIEKLEICKNLKKDEQNLYEKLRTYTSFEKESLVYNRIYEMKRGNYVL